MIRINLLGAPKPRKGKRQTTAVSVDSGEGPSIVLVALLIFLIAGVGNGFWYFRLKRESDQLGRDMATANAEYARLTQVKVRYEELEKQKDAYKKRVDVIDELHSRQSGPVNLLATLGDTVNHTDEVWLKDMSDDGNNINIKGMALSVHAVADLMRNLKNTGYFKNVEIKSSYQDERVRDMQAFIFELSCEKQPAQAPAIQPAQPKKS